MRRVHEVWKPVKGYEDSYKVSNQGRVKSLDRVIKYMRAGKECEMKVEGKMLNAYKGSSYLRVSLRKDNEKAKLIAVHRLVADAFVENPKSKPVVNHIDSNPHNNKAKNLEWVTQRENVRHSQDVGRRYKRTPYWYDQY